MRFIEIQGLRRHHRVQNALNSLHHALHRTPIGVLLTQELLFLVGVKLTQ